MKKATITLLLWLTALSALADTRYITDEFSIMMRSGESSSHRIVRQLSSGTRVKVLSSNAETGYSEVRIEDGTTGYVLTHQLMEQPSARSQLAAMQSRLSELQDEPDKLAGKLSALRDQYAELQAENEQLHKASSELEQELETIRRTSANAVRISNERNELRKDVSSLTRQVEDLKQQNRDLSNQTAQNWFMIGAGVIIIGIVLGLILPHLRFQRRKNSWGSL